ncbi:hypothetical protein [Kribbella steppae]|uniref:hypothetical protein n=1 Tax=Kribbella steppae TaxID=2512223 RepID=UPI00104F2C90|nr:hypothetical protein [Kribbella steppae]
MTNPVGLLSRILLSTIPIVFFVAVMVRVVVAAWSRLKIKSWFIKKLNAKLAIEPTYASIAYGLGFAVLITTVPWGYFIIFLVLTVPAVVPLLFLDWWVPTFAQWHYKRSVKEAAPEVYVLVQGLSADGVEKLMKITGFDYGMGRGGAFRFVVPLAMAWAVVILSFPTAFWMPFEKIQPKGEEAFTAFVLTRDADELVLLTPVRKQVVRVPAQTTTRELCDPSPVSENWQNVLRDPKEGELNWLATVDMQPSLIQLTSRAPQQLVLPACPPRFER